MRPASGRITAGILVSLFVSGMVSILYGHQLDSPVSLGRTKGMAETQHEIVMLLIKQKEYQKAASEANKIFDMKWPEDQEPLLLRELLILSDQFRKEGQAHLGLQLIDKNSKCFKKTSSQIAILKEKGYLYKNLNENEKAIDSFRKARELESKD